MSDPAPLLVPARPEPVALRRALRALAGDDPVTGRSEATRRLAATLWRTWRAEFAPHGMTAKQFREVVAGAGQEVWLWVMGDRPFDQIQESIAGRARRRLER